MNLLCLVQPLSSQPARHNGSVKSIFAIGLTLIVIVAGLSPCTVQSQGEKRGKSSVELPFRPFRAVQRFPVVRDFSIAGVAKLDDQINPDELVIGVTIDGKSRAYPINMLNGPSREIINDTLADVAIAATW